MLWWQFQVKVYLIFRPILKTRLQEESKQWVFIPFDTALMVRSIFWSVVEKKIHGINTQRRKHAAMTREKHILRMWGISDVWRSNFGLINCVYRFKMTPNKSRLQITNISFVTFSTKFFGRNFFESTRQMLVLLLPYKVYIVTEQHWIELTDSGKCIKNF